MDINDCLKALDDGTQIVTTTFGWLEKWQEQSHSQGFNTAIDKVVEVVERNRHKRCTDMNDDWREGYNEALDWTYKELKKLKELEGDNG